MKRISRIVAIGVVALSALCLAAHAQTTPAAPTNLVATAASTSQINLSWTDSSTNEDEFKIERASDSGGSPGIWSQIAAVNTNVTSYGDTGLSDNTKYWYRVRAFNAAGDSPFSDQASATTLCGTVIITTQPVSRTVCSGTGVQFSVAATGESLSYRWRKDGVSLSNGGTISGTDGPILTITNVSKSATSCGAVAAGSPVGVVFMDVVAGETYYCQASGCVGLNLGCGNSPCTKVDPDGALCGGAFYSGSTNFICPSLTAYSLVGKIGNDCIQLGKVAAFTAPASGTLVLYCNDYNNGDNSGAWGLCIGSGSEGTYDVIVTGACGSQTSSGAVLSVNSTACMALAVTTPGDFAYTTNSSITIVGTASATVGLSAVTVNSVAATSGDGYTNWTSTVSGLAVGTNTLTVIAADNAVPAHSLTNNWHVIFATGSFDGNGDGLPDAWQIRYFGSVAAADAAPNADPDGDGVLNQQEFLDETNPTLPAPAAPSSLSATPVPTNRIDLAWVDNAGIEDGFKIDRAVDIGGNPGTWAQIATVTSNITDYSDVGALPNIRYWYRVRAYNSNGNSLASSSVSVMIAIPPITPSGLTAVRGKQIDLSWTDNATNEDGFKIERSPDSSGSPGIWTQIVTVAANVTNYTDRGLVPGATYWYRVRAYNPGGDSDYSNVAGATSPDLVVPTSLAAAAISTNQINLSWTDNSTNEVGFAVERAPDAGGSPDTWSQIATVGANVTNYNDTGLSPGTKYWYRVHAYRAAEGSDYSNQASASTPALCPRLVVGWGNNAAATVPSGLEWVVAIAAGYEHSLALKADGTVVGWGSGSAATPPAGLSNVVAIAAGDNQSLAAKSDGTVVKWGFNSQSLPAGLSNVVAVAAGYYHSLALKRDGTVVGWGSPPTTPTGLSNVVAIAAGEMHGLALKRDGTVIQWGSGTAPSGLSNVVAISAAGYQSLALKRDGTVVGWGGPTVPASLSNVVAVAAGWSGFDLAVKSNGTVVAWGDNWCSQTNFPAGLNRVIAVAAGYCHGLALTLPCSLSAPSALTATAVSYRQINLSWLDNSGDETSFKIERSIDGTNFSQIAQKPNNATSHMDVNLMPGATYYYRVRASSAAGDSEYSNVSVAGTPAMCAASVVRWSFSVSTPPAGWTGIVAIAMGYNQGLGLRSDGTVVNWFGYTPPSGLTGVVAIASGGIHNLALKGDGTVVGWGSNNYGQTNPPAGLSGVVGIAAGYYHSLALKSDGTVISWGRNNFGQTNTPAGLTGVVAITAGYYQSLALKYDGTVIGWGGNLYGEASPPSGLLATAISAGSYHSLALKKDGTVVGWGDNSWGKATPPANLTGVVAIAAGNYHSLALKNDGTVIGWGNSSYGNSPTGLTGVVAIAACNYENMAMSCAPSPPCCLSATGVGASQIDLNWTDNSGNEERFGIERAGTSTGPWTEIGSVDSNVTTYSDTGVSCSQTHYYRVRAYNAAAGSPYSSPVNANTSNADADSDGIRDCWTLQYFGHPTGQESDNSRAVDDADGDGFTNLQEFQSGTDATNSASAFRITSVVVTGNDVDVTWTMGSGKTNALQATVGDGGSYTNAFADLFVVTNTVGSVTNYLDLGAVTNVPARYYRVRLVP